MVKAVSTVLQPHGFTNKGLNWYKSALETIILLSLDRPFPDQYVVMVAFNLKNKNPEIHPKFWKCHWYGPLMTITASGQKGGIVMDFNELERKVWSISSDGVRKNSSGKVFRDYYAPTIEALAHKIQTKEFHF